MRECERGWGVTREVARNFWWGDDGNDLIGSYSKNFSGGGIHPPSPLATPLGVARE